MFQVLFSTKKYSCDKQKLGKNFDKYAHLTNWSLHGLPANHERLLADKVFYCELNNIA